MDNIIYSKTIVPANESEDGESPTRVIVTQEQNCFLIWLTGYNGTFIIDCINKFSRDKAIECGVDFGRYSLSELTEIADSFNLRG